MKIAILGKWPQEKMSGGVSVHLLNLTKYLGKHNNVRLYVISFNNKDEIIAKDNAIIYNIKINVFYYIFPLLAIYKLSKIMALIKPDIIHLQGNNFSPYLIYALIQKQIPKVVTIHGFYIGELLIRKRIFLNIILKKICTICENIIVKDFDWIITVSSSLKEWYVNKYGERIKEKISVIGSGIDINKFNYNKNMPFRQKVRKELTILDNELLILHAKSFMRFNGQEYLIKVMPFLQIKGYKAKLMLAGEGPEKKEMIRLSKKLGVYENIIFLGEIKNTEMPRYISASDIVVIPSVKINELEEGPSIFLLESMAMGKPVIASNIGGLKDIIKNGHNGILVSDKKPEEIALSIIKLIKEPSYGKYISNNARKFVRDTKTWHSVTEEVIYVYSNILKRKKEIM